MFIGHYGLALATKRAAPRVSLGALIAAAQLADLIWPMLLLVGLEHVSIVPNANPFLRLSFDSYPAGDRPDRTLAIVGIRGAARDPVPGERIRAAAGKRDGHCVGDARFVAHPSLRMVARPASGDGVTWPSPSR